MQKMYLSQGISVGCIGVRNCLSQESHGAIDSYMRNNRALLETI
jgi:hypothetical protein